MRIKSTDDQLTVQAFAGTYVVMLGMSLPKSKVKKLLGFAIKRTDHSTGDSSWMRAYKTFEGTLPGPGVMVSTLEHPLQSFQWADYSAKPGRTYTYKVAAMKGTPSDLSEAEAVEVTVNTEPEAGATHDIYFNRGVAGSQEYARRFQNRSPDEVGDAAFQWLSRGLVEALIAFIGQAQSSKDEIVGAIYEFRNLEVMTALKAANKRGVKVKLIYGADKPNVTVPNEEAIKEAGIKGLCQPRENGPGIPHNKFFVWSRNGKPQCTWSGSTNLTQNGIFGHSNVGHVVRDKDVAKQFRAYWDLLAGDPDGRDSRDWCNTATPCPVSSWTPATQLIFSPREFPASGSANALNYYAELAGRAKKGLFMTFAFGINPTLLKVFQQNDSVLRFALMENLGMSAEARNAVTKMRKLPNAVVAVGNRIETNRFDRWLNEDARVSRQTHVEYIHTKYMLVDPLSDEPMVVTGSANFSKASVYSNDENMLLIHKDTRVADVYLGEFMRLYSHHAFREYVKRSRQTSDVEFRHLESTDKWTRDYYVNNATARQARRKYFSGT